ncbi:MAG: translocase [Candidatus Aminicenantes bacterium]|nr:translocase [Candidatus Aminicenantes bacterium]
MDANHSNITGEQGQKSPGLIYKLLKIFTDIKPGEALTSFLLMFNIFLLLTAYYIIKPVREALIIGEWSPEVKSYLSAAIAVLLVFVVKAFSSMASRVPRQILITYVTLFFISNLVLFYILSVSNLSSKAMGIIFFLWMGVFNVMVIAQFWAFANDMYTLEEGKRLFPLIAFGATFGGFMGSKLSGWIVGSMGLYQTMLVAGAFLSVCILLTFIIHKREIERKELLLETLRAEAEQKPLEKGGGFKLLFQNKYLLYIAVFVLLLNFVNTNGEWVLGRVANLSAANALSSGTASGLTENQLIAQFYANFNSVMSIISMVVQLFLVSRIFKWFGVRFAIFVLPLISLGGYSLIGLGAALSVVTYVKAAENGTDYSLMNTTRHALFLITSREEKYKAKAAIDTFFHRAGDVLSGTLVLIGTTYFALNIQKAAVFNIFVVILWIFIGVLIAREHKKLTAQKAVEAVD